MKISREGGDADARFDVELLELFSLPLMAKSDIDLLIIGISSDDAYFTARR